MSPLEGANHARAERWSELKLPVSDVVVGALHVLSRCDNLTSDPGVPLAVTLQRKPIVLRPSANAYIDHSTTDGNPLLQHRTPQYVSICLLCGSFVGV